MKDLLIELLSEEIPSKFQLDAVQQFRLLLENSLKSDGFDVSDVEADITPRRMYFLAKVSGLSHEITIEKRGPLVSAPENSILCFLNANSISRNECEERTVNGKQYLFAKLITKSKKLHQVLPEIINDVVCKIKWNKSMHWEHNNFYWARPLRGIMCIYDRDVIDVEIDKIGLRSTNTTIGHRVIGQKRITVPSAYSYKQLMKDNGIILNRNERKEEILLNFAKIEKLYDIEINKDEALLDEVIGLVEHPKAFVGKISDDYMMLPEEVLTVTMRIHQRYFITRTHDNKISKYFVFVSNIEPTDDGETVIHGNQKVLAARLCDAKFFFENDLKFPLLHYNTELKKITFYEGLGSVFDRTQRIEYITQDLAQYATEPNQLQRAAKLCKCDLRTSIVSEFPEVQGVYGGHVASLQGEPEYVAQAISEQYLPVGDSIPQSNGGSLLAIADKLDLLVSFFAIKKSPNGSKDPFGLRRAAIGVLRIIIENKFSINNLYEIIKNAFERLKEQFASVQLDEATPGNVMLFLKNRFAVIARNNNLKYFELFIDKGNFLTAFEESKKFESTNDVEQMLEVFKRAYSIYPPNSSAAYINKDLFKTQYEYELFHALTSSECEFCELYKKSIDFFDNVLVNVDDKLIRENRLALIHELLRYFYKIGDFHKLI